jgi:hypothetical protein
METKRIFGGFMSSFDNRTDTASAQHRGRAERRTSPALAAYYWNGSNPQQNPVKDISSTGAYLLTDERWNPGDLITLTLQRIGPLESSPELSFAVQAKAVRWDEHGVAVSFVLPAGADLRLWQSPLKSASEQTEPEDILREFRVAQAIAFLSRISPAASGTMRKLLHEELSNYRLDCAVDIVLQAEKLLHTQPNGDKLLAPAPIIQRIIEDGSWTDDPWMLQFWAGLLATSCTADGQDESGLKFVDLMCQLKSINLRILAAACTKSTKMVVGLGRVSSRPVVWTATDLKKITGSHDLIRIERDLEHMNDMGLISDRVKSTFFSPISETKFTPTSLSLELYARCNGHRGTPQGFYGMAPAARTTLPIEL